MKKNKKRVFIGYRMPARFYKQISELLPLYNFSLSDVLTAILINWEVSDFHRKQELRLSETRFSVLENESQIKPKSL